MTARIRGAADQGCRGSATRRPPAAPAAPCRRGLAATPQGGDTMVVGATCILGAANKADVSETFGRRVAVRTGGYSAPGDEYYLFDLDGV